MVTHTRVYQTLSAMKLLSFPILHTNKTEKQFNLSWAYRYLYEKAKEQTKPGQLMSPGWASSRQRSVSSFPPGTHVHLYARMLTHYSVLLTQAVQPSRCPNKGSLLLFALAFFSALPLPCNCTAAARAANNSLLLLPQSKEEACKLWGPASTTRHLIINFVDACKW